MFVGWDASLGFSFLASYPSVPGHVSTTTLFLFLVMFRVRVCHLLCHNHNLLYQEDKHHTP